MIIEKCFTNENPSQWKYELKIIQFSNDGWTGRP